MAEKHKTFTNNDYSKHRGPSHGSWQINYNNTENRNKTRKKAKIANQPDLISKQMGLSAKELLVYLNKQSESLKILLPLPKPIW